MWKLKVAGIGRLIWSYEEEEEGNIESVVAMKAVQEQFTQNRHVSKHSSDRIMRLQLIEMNPLPQMPPQVVIQVVTVCDVDVTLRRALRFYSSLQAEDGHWPGDYGGPLFLMPGLIFTLYITGTMDIVLSPAHKHEMRRYLLNHQNEDGGWGLHIEGHSTMFGSILSYVSLRLLGQEADSQDLERGLKWIFDHGGTVAVPSWGKFWLSVLGVFDWSGVAPLPPEMYLLPYALPLHPGRMWCHCRMVYLPMSYIYGRRFTGELTETIKALRRELYAGLYDHVDWNQARHACAKEDLYYPHTLIQDFVWGVLHLGVEPALRHWPGSLLRKKALDTVLEHIHFEDENTNYICIGPVNKALNMLCCWVEDPNSEAFKRHIPRVYDYLWLAEDGMKMQGYNGSQLWDTAFAVQALISTRMLDESGNMLRKAHWYIEQSQVHENPAGDLDRFYRHKSKGAWPFSTRDHGWPISDCSAEGLKAALLLSLLPAEIVGESIPAERLFDCVDVILSYQNENGGVSTYELTRSYYWIELFNPAETFGDIILDYPYVECTSACIQALCLFREIHPGVRTKGIMKFIQKGCKFIERMQRPDGSWYGSWGVCFTYGTWFAIRGLTAAGKTHETCLSIRRACEFLLSKQLVSGAWGESYLSSQNKVYTHIQDGRGHLVNTAWAMLGLILAGQAERDRVPLDKAAAFVINKQLENGDFPQEEIIGVFNKNCMISYSAYRCIFPIWALGEYLSTRQR